MNDYYEALDAASEGQSATKNGWRCRSMQYLRYEIAAVKSGLRQQDTLVDLGCGSAAVESYLRRWWDGRYTGIDQRASVMPREAKRGGPSSQYLVGNFMDEAAGVTAHDIAFGIGALVDGESRRRSERRDYVWRHLDRMHQFGQRGWAVIALDEDRHRDAPYLRLDPCLQGIRRDEIDSWCRAKGVEVEAEHHLLPGEWVISWRDDSRDERVSRDALFYYEAALRASEELHGQSPSAVEEAKYWVALERYGRAIRALKRCEQRSREVRLIEERIALATQD